MTHAIDDLLKQYELGKLARRDLLAALALLIDAGAIACSSS